MKEMPNFTVEINGLSGDFFVSGNNVDRYMCVFLNTGTTDFAPMYNAYGFMACLDNPKGRQTELYPIKLKAETTLSVDIMNEMWRQIDAQLDYFRQLSSVMQD